MRTPPSATKMRLETAMIERVGGYDGGVASDCKSDPFEVNTGGSNPSPRTNLFSAAKNTKQQGNVGMGIAIAHYVAKMFIVSVPLNDSQDYDLIVDKGDGPLRVQVKTCCFFRKGGYPLMMSMQGGNRKENYVGRFGTDFKYDILFAVTGDGMKYEIPRSAISHIRRRLQLPSKYSQYIAL